ncbi:unnamed protein product, partial [Phaeothamnion confervicola]
MVRWLLSRGFVEELLGPRSHVELVRRADTVLRFLAAEDALGWAHLEALWACAEGRH